MIKITLSLLFFGIIRTICACNTDISKTNQSEIPNWLGSNSNFSKVYREGKFALDKVLIDLPLEQRRIIANLIAKSYTNSLKVLKESSTYKY